VTNDRAEVSAVRLVLALATLVLPALVTGAWCAVATGKLVAVLAPTWGPFAGMLVGHEDCTMARVWPEASLVTGAVGLLALNFLFFARRTATWTVGLALWILFSLGWCALAGLSILNSLE